MSCHDCEGKKGLLLPTEELIKDNIYLIQGILEIDMIGYPDQDGLKARYDQCSLHYVRDKLLLYWMKLMKGELKLEDEKKHPLIIVIDSPGGEVSSVFQVYDIMQNLIAMGIKIYTVGLSLGASGGAFLLMSGTKGYRFVLPHTRVMCHLARQSPSGAREEPLPLMPTAPIGQGDNLEEDQEEKLRLYEEQKRVYEEMLKIAARKRKQKEEADKEALVEFKRMQEQLVDIIMKHCKNDDQTSRSTIRSEMAKKDFWFEDQKTVDYGIVDYVLSPETVAVLSALFNLNPSDSR